MRRKSYSYEWLCALPLTLISCQDAQSTMAADGIPAVVRLQPGRYDVPFHVEPPRPIELTAERIGLNREGGLGGEMSPGLSEQDLIAVKGAPEPVQIEAYKYRARPTEELSLVHDPSELAAASPLTQICSGEGCVRFYIKGELVRFTFRTNEQAAAYEGALLAHLNRFSRSPPEVRNGISFISDTQAVWRNNRSVFVISSWSPTTVTAIVAQLGKGRT